MGYLQYRFHVWKIMIEREDNSILLGNFLIYMALIVTKFLRINVTLPVALSAWSMIQESSQERKKNQWILLMYHFNVTWKVSSHFKALYHSSDFSEYIWHLLDSDFTFALQNNIHKILFQCRYRSAPACPSGDLYCNNGVEEDRNRENIYLSSKGRRMCSALQ